MEPQHGGQRLRQVSSSYAVDDEVAIIGGGAAGLAAAFFLVQSGHTPDKIVVYEQGDYFGGHARSIYLHQVSGAELYVIKHYQLHIVDHEPILKFVDHNGDEQHLPLIGTRQLVPVDVGFCGSSTHYHNLGKLLIQLAKQAGGPARVPGTFARYDYGKEVSYGVEVDGLVLRSDKWLWGQLFQPWNWYRAYRLYADTDKLVRYCAVKGLAYWRNKTVRELVRELRALSIRETTLTWILSFCQIGSGFSDAQFSEISAAYWYTFFTQGNFHNLGVRNMIFMHGASAYIAGLTAFLQGHGVRLVHAPGRRAKHTIYAVQPYDSDSVDAALPQIKRSQALAYVHCDASVVGNKKLDTVLGYGVINGIAQASWDVDAMRPDHPDVGAFVTFTTPDHEVELDRRLFGKEAPRYLRQGKRNDHNLYEAPLKILWHHAVINVAAEQLRRNFWREAQGKDNRYYCGSSYLKCMLHDNAITSALDVVCLLTGAHDRLREQGFSVSDDTYELYGGN